MKKTHLIALAAAFSLTLSSLPLLVSGGSNEYDPSDDPLVSLSYINEVLVPSYDKKIAELEDTVDELNASLKIMQESLTAADAKIASLEAELEKVPEDTGNDAAFEVVYLKGGAKLLADSPCEIILRSGSAIVVSITVNGLNDITDGTELANTAAVPLFHQLLVPRGGDGRGIQITSADAYVMVRGDYQIVE